MLLYLPDQIPFLIKGEHVTCHGSKLTNLLGKQRLQRLMWTWSGHAPETAANLCPSQYQASNFIAVSIIFWVGKYTSSI